MSYLYPYVPIYTYFNEVLGFPDWSSKNILDFGGNVGNFLKDPNCNVHPSYYTCLDISKAAIDHGQAEFPKANWLYYNRYNCVYNKLGHKNESLPQLQNKFDFILAFSVFTHTSQKEMLSTVQNELMPLLNKTGKLAFTFLEPYMISHFVDKRIQNNPEISQDNIILQTENLSHFYYINDDIIQFEFKDDGTEDLQHLLSFYSVSDIQNLFSNYKTNLYTVPNSLLQSCIVLENN